MFRLQMLNTFLQVKSFNFIKRHIPFFFQFFQVLFAVDTFLVKKAHVSLQDPRLGHDVLFEQLVAVDRVF